MRTYRVFIDMSKLLVLVGASFGIVDDEEDAIAFAAWLIC